MDTPIYNAMTNRLSPETFGGLVQQALARKIEEVKIFLGVTSR